MGDLKLNFTSENRLHIYCSDLKNYQVLGSFLETLSFLRKRNQNIIPVVIAGPRDAIKLKLLQNIIEEKLGLKDGYYACSASPIEEKIAESRATEILEECRNLEDVKKIRYNNTNLGISIISSIISKYRCTDINIDIHKKDIIAYATYSILFLNKFIEYITQKTEQKDIIFIYNGRHYNTHPESLYTESLSLEIYYYERINGGKKLIIQKPRIHDFISRSKTVKKFWIKSIDKSKSDIGHLFFKKQGENKFSKSNDKGLLIEKPYIVYFPSSEDEYACLDERIALSATFKSQRKAIKWLIDWASDQEKYKLVVRLHPNQKNICKKDYQFWHNDIRGKNTILIPSHSKIDSYQLATKAEKVISFLSTMGVEATYMGIPSITIGNPLYKGLDTVYEPLSPKQLKILLEAKIPPKKKESTIPFGYYSLMFGETISFYQELSFHTFEEYERLLEN